MITTLVPQFFTTVWDLAIEELRDQSGPDRATLLTPDVHGYRLGAEWEAGEVYVLALGGDFDGFPVQVNRIPNTDDWVSFGPVAASGELPDDHNGIHHESLTDACVWAVRALIATHPGIVAELRVAHALKVVRDTWPKATHVHLGSGPDDRLGLVEVLACTADGRKETLWSDIVDGAGDFSAVTLVDFLLLGALVVGFNPAGEGWQQHRPGAPALPPLERWRVRLDTAAPLRH